MNSSYEVRSVREHYSTASSGDGISHDPFFAVFVCANCARPGKELTSAGRARPAIPEFNWPYPVQQIIVPCAGRLQPEHVLKMFESGASIVSVIACQENNCHYIEGSSRCARRVDYIRSILTEIGLGDERLLLSYLPGSAAEDLALASGKTASANFVDALAPQVAAIREQVVRAFQIIPSNPLLQQVVAGTPRMLSRKK
jgi:F420-non-reducing hydrogenase iron-sulfur subunit